MFTAQIRFDKYTVRVEDPIYKMTTHLVPGHIGKFHETCFSR